jgi:hypothetical protein
MSNYTELTSGTPKLAPYLRKKEYFQNCLLPLSEPDGLQVEYLLDILIETYQKLKELGVREVDGKIVFIDIIGENL